MIFGNYAIILFVFLMIFFQSYVTIITIKNKVEPKTKIENEVRLTCYLYIIALSIMLSTCLGVFTPLFTVLLFVLVRFVILHLFSKQDAVALKKIYDFFLFCTLVISYVYILWYIWQILFFIFSLFIENIVYIRILNFIIITAIVLFV
jgi:hypothetical protein